MLTKDVSDEIQAALASLQSDGKEPSVALVKARLTTKVPMPAIIAAIKSWKSGNHVPKIEVAAEQQPNLEQRIIDLELQLKQLKERLSLLESKL
ncbi:hypothetical protein LNL84_13400 [Vibrio sp. ZSDZ34]|uniref:KfrA N-terminal DNA-binding domain-containing protein n=1 Tax=Vibrio gelatinilyticus TaxID=2893468 RepID=A0A9X1WBH0_9VIBR|nr:hypothetical protein [Vibrio gelatinilyticus]MCJ2377827.1 hypothetical protein [Vibrio gelatinilyticus]